MSCIAARGHVKAGGRKLYPSVRSISLQRQQRGLSLSFCSLLLNLHETSLMSFEMGVLLPSDEMMCRMKMLGFSLSTDGLNLNESCINELDRAVYRLLAFASFEEVSYINSSATFFISVNYHNGSLIRRDLLLLKLLQHHRRSLQF